MARKRNLIRSQQIIELYLQGRTPDKMHLPALSQQQVADKAGCHVSCVARTYRAYLKSGLQLPSYCFTNLHPLAAAGLSVYFPGQNNYTVVEVAQFRKAVIAAIKGKASADEKFLVHEAKLFVDVAN